MNDPLNLGGQWSGLFNYPIPSPPTMFEAVLSDNEGLISGFTSERGDTPECFGRTLRAMIDGRRDGNLVRFVKMYDDGSEFRDFVHYSGTIQSDGTEIQGSWDIPGEWSGTFLMVRKGKAAIAKERRVDATV